MKKYDIVRVIQLGASDVGIEVGCEGAIEYESPFNDGSFDDCFDVRLFKDTSELKNVNKNIKSDGTYTFYREQLEVIERESLIKKEKQSMKCEYMVIYTSDMKTLGRGIVKASKPIDSSDALFALDKAIEESGGEKDVKVIYYKLLGTMEE